MAALQAAKKKFLHTLPALKVAWAQSCPAAQARLRPQLGAPPQRSKWLLQRVPNEGILGARGKKGCFGELKRTVLRKF